MIVVIETTIQTFDIHLPLISGVFLVDELEEVLLELSFLEITSIAPNK